MDGFGLSCMHDIFVRQSKLLPADEVELVAKESFSDGQLDDNHDKDHRHHRL